MPIFKYLIFVSGLLIGALFIVTPFFPADVRQRKSGDEISGINIKSDQKWPEKIVYDTSLPTIDPPPAIAGSAEEPVSSSLDTSIQRTNDAMAEMKPTAAELDSRKAKVTAAPKKVQAAKKSVRYKLARRRAPESDFLFDW